MTDASETQVLIAGGGPIGLTTAIELARRGIACRILDPLLEPLQYAKAVGVQPRTLEVFEGMGVLRQILDAAVQMRGQIVYVNGERVTQLDFTLPDDIPFGFIGFRSTPPRRSCARSSRCTACRCRAACASPTLSRMPTA
jgi:2-polyprenyl-6-methoxyphenol hydroxylase-like FAD-dependent oxidoreductase